MGAAAPASPALTDTPLWQLRAPPRLQVDEFCAQFCAAAAELARSEGATAASWLRKLLRGVVKAGIVRDAELVRSLLARSHAAASAGLLQAAGSGSDSSDGSGLGHAHGGAAALGDAHVQQELCDVLCRAVQRICGFERASRALRALAEACTAEAKLRCIAMCTGSLCAQLQRFGDLVTCVPRARRRRLGAAPPHSPRGLRPQRPARRAAPRAARRRTAGVRTCGQAGDARSAAAVR